MKIRKLPHRAELLSLFNFLVLVNKVFFSQSSLEWNLLKGQDNLLILLMYVHFLQIFKRGKAQYEIKKYSKVYYFNHHISFNKKWGIKRNRERSKRREQCICFCKPQIDHFQACLILLFFNKQQKQNISEAYRHGLESQLCFFWKS